MQEKVIITLPEGRFVLQLFVSGMSPKSLDAIENLQKICSQYLKDNYDLTIIDIYKNPELALQHSIIFSPSLLKLAPLPKKILIGTLKDTTIVLKALSIIISKSK